MSVVDISKEKIVQISVSSNLDSEVWNETVICLTDTGRVLRGEAFFVRGDKDFRWIDITPSDRLRNK